MSLQWALNLGIFIYLRFKKQRSAMLYQSNDFLLRTCSQFTFLHVWDRILHSSVVLCWICLEDNATSADALEDEWDGVGSGGLDVL